MVERYENNRIYIIYINLCNLKIITGIVRLSILLVKVYYMYYIYLYIYILSGNLCLSGACLIVFTITIMNLMTELLQILTKLGWIPKLVYNKDGKWKLTWILLQKELSLCHKQKMLNHFIFPTWSSYPKTYVHKVQKHSNIALLKTLNRLVELKQWNV